MSWGSLARDDRSGSINDIATQRSRFGNVCLSGNDLYGKWTGLCADVVVPAGWTSDPSSTHAQGSQRGARDPCSTNVYPRPPHDHIASTLLPTHLKLGRHTRLTNMATPTTSASLSEVDAAEASKRYAQTASDRQRAQLEKLLKDPTKPAFVPAPPKEKALRAPREMMKNVQGSSAGAGSGEFHVYKASRRREYERIKMMEEESARVSALLMLHSPVIASAHPTCRRRSRPSLRGASKSATLWRTRRRPRIGPSVTRRR
jgi:hypothetical protein